MTGGFERITLSGRQRRWEAGQRLCAICGLPVPRPGDVLTGKSAPTIDHVFPRAPRQEDLARIAILRGLSGGRRGVAIAHSKCNSKKGNRPPTACEVIFLMAVNARLRNCPAEFRTARRDAERRARRHAKRQAAWVKKRARWAMEAAE